MIASYLFTMMEFQVKARRFCLRLLRPPRPNLKILCHRFHPRLFLGCRRMASITGLISQASDQATSPWTSGTATPIQEIVELGQGFLDEEARRGPAFPLRSLVSAKSIKASAARLTSHTPSTDLP